MRSGIAGSTCFEDRPYPTVNGWSTKMRRASLFDPRAASTPCRVDEARYEHLLVFIAANMRRLREKSGLTQEALAERADLALRTVAEIETGRVNIRVTVLAAIAEALNVTPGTLLKPAEMPEIVRGRPKKQPAK